MGTSDTYLDASTASMGSAEKWSTGLQPRDYQLSLFREALRRNSIIMLETGTGKTLVSVMLIEWFAQHSSNKAADISARLDSGSHTPPRRKVRVFLNNTVALVYQQAKVIAENTRQKVETFVGSSGIGEWNDNTWSDKWMKSSVFVMTHQVFLSALRSGRAKLEDIDLLVFDECHHARGNHPYALIMREFYDHCNPGARPHVFGMTASPLNAQKTAESSVMQLQATLDSGVCTIDLTANPNVANAQKTSLCYEYALPPNYDHTELTVALADACNGSLAVGLAMKYVEVLLPMLGPFGVDLMWHHFIRKWHRKVLLCPVTTRYPTRPTATHSLAMAVDDRYDGSNSTDGVDDVSGLYPRSPVPSGINIASSGQVLEDDFDIVEGDDISVVSSGVDQVAYNEAVAAAAAVLRNNSSTFSSTIVEETARQNAAFLKKALHLDAQFGGIPFHAASTADNILDFKISVSLSPTNTTHSRPHPNSVPRHPNPLLQSVSNCRRPWNKLQSHLSPQVNRLLSILHQWSLRPSEIRGIVFTERRITAITLACIVTSIAEFAFIRTDVLLGSATKAGMGLMDQHIRGGSVKAANLAVLDDFACGRLNLIFATQVAEEGLDIQPCNLIIRFDMPNTTTSLIQSRGRARMAESQFIVLVPEIDEMQARLLKYAHVPKGAPQVVVSRDAYSSEAAAPNTDDDYITSDSALSSAMSLDGDGVEYGCLPGSYTRQTTQHCLKEKPKTYTDYLQLVRLEECLRDWCLAESQKKKRTFVDGVITSGRSHAEYGLLLRRMRASLTLDSGDAMDEDNEEPWIESRDAVGRIYTIKATGACITYLSAINIVMRYVQSLPQDDYCKLTPEITFEEKIIETDQTGQFIDNTTMRRRVPKPLRTSVFRCLVSFPSNAALRLVVGPYMPKKKIAKQVASYRAAKKLHQLGVIDDNLLPISVAQEAAVRLAKTIELKEGKSKGTRSLVRTYDTTVPQQFIQPSSSGASMATDSYGDKVYQPMVWHLYSFSLRHTTSSAPTNLILVTARELPPDTAVPLYLEQQVYKADSKADSIAAIESKPASPTLIRLQHIGEQLMDLAQVDALASFSSKLMLRIVHKAFAWKSGEIGAMVAPPLEDGSIGIDFEKAKSIFKNRDTVFNQYGPDISRFRDRVLVDALDHGRLKTIKYVCEDADLYTDLANYHAKFKEEGGLVADRGAVELVPTSSPNQSCSPSTDTASTASGDSPVLSGSMGGMSKSSKKATKTMEQWASVKRVDRLLPDKKVGQDVPLLRVKPLAPSINYLAPAIPVSLESPAASDAALYAAKQEPSTELEYPDVIYTSPFFCSVEALSIHDIYNLSILPAFLCRLEHVLLAAGIKKQLSLVAKTETVRQAITASSSSTDVNYERLETLGDSVLKYIVTVMLFVTYPNDHEGLLALRRDKIVCNANLYSVARSLGLAESIIARIFARHDVKLPGLGWARFKDIPRKWIINTASSTNSESVATNSGDSEDSKDAVPSPSSSSSMPPTLQSSPDSAGFDSRCFEGPKSDPKPENIAEPVTTGGEAHTRKLAKTISFSTAKPLSEKTVADVIESLLGASILDGGMEGALAAARSLGILSLKWESWACFGRCWEEKELQRKRSVATLGSLCEKIMDGLSSELSKDELAQEAELDKQDVIYAQASMYAKDCGGDLVGWKPDLGFMSGSQFGPSASGDVWMAEVEGVLGYTFKNRALLLEALTHCGVSDLVSPSYQRLEFLGDAIIDYHVTRRYYDYLPELRPHRITLVKHVAVSNDLFGIILVCNGLHRYIRHTSAALSESVRDYETRLTRVRSIWAASRGPECAEMEDEVDGDRVFSARRNSASGIGMSQQQDGENASEVRPTKCKRTASPPQERECDGVYSNLPPECWNMVQAPKVLGDVFESLIGAMYVDSGMDNAIAQMAYQKLLCPFLDRFVDSGKLTLHPVIQSLLISQHWGCSMVSWETQANDNLMEFVDRYICEIKAHGHVLAVGAGESPRHAKYLAASTFLLKIGATAPNTLDDDLQLVQNMVPRSSLLDQILKPICTCALER
ncbi:Dicer-like protein 1 [Coemansia sp. Benny D115]|nr:Dicer-like protein 1 [Coemansia sp. Benny D115]